MQEEPPTRNVAEGSGHHEHRDFDALELELQMEMHELKALEAQLLQEQHPMHREEPSDVLCDGNDPEDEHSIPDLTVVLQKEMRQLRSLETQLHQQQFKVREEQHDHRARRKLLDGELRQLAEQKQQLQQAELQEGLQSAPQPAQQRRALVAACRQGGGLRPSEGLPAEALEPLPLQEVLDEERHRRVQLQTYLDDARQREEELRRAVHELELQVQAQHRLDDQLREERHRQTVLQNSLERERARRAAAEAELARERAWREGAERHVAEAHCQTDPTQLSWAQCPEEVKDLRELPEEKARCGEAHDGLARERARSAALARKLADRDAVRRGERGLLRCLASWQRAAQCGVSARRHRQLLLASRCFHAWAQRWSCRQPSPPRAAPPQQPLSPSLCVHWAADLARLCGEEGIPSSRFDGASAPPAGPPGPARLCPGPGAPEQAPRLALGAGVGAGGAVWAIPVRSDGHRAVFGGKRDLVDT